MRLKKYLILLLICILGCMLLVAGCGKSDSKKDKVPESKTVTITDSAGRSVELPQPLEKVATLNGNVVEAMRILKVQDKVIGVSESIQKDAYLDMQEKDLVGKGFQPNYEKVVELRPQVFISYSTYGPGAELAEKLEPAGIKVVLLDLHKPETYDNDFEVLAKMFGKEKEANAFLKWKSEKIAALDKVKNIQSEQRVNVLSMTTDSIQKEKWKVAASDTAAHQAVDMAGGINIAQEFKGYSEVSPEWILQQNPGVLVVADYTRDLVGFNVKDFGNVEKFKEKLVQNIVLSKTDVVKNDRIYIIPNGLLGGDKSYLGAQYLAKWFYPDQFKELDPDKVIKEYFEKWLDVPFQGKWAYPPSTK
jgi:iron complex transport system substrate-binding protein